MGDRIHISVFYNSNFCMMKTILLIIIILFAGIGITATVAFLVFCYQEGRKKIKAVSKKVNTNHLGEEEQI